MATFWEEAAHSVDHMFPLYSDYLLLFPVLVLRALFGFRLLQFHVISYLLLSYYVCEYYTIFVYSS